MNIIHVMFFPVKFLFKFKRVAIFFRKRAVSGQTLIIKCNYDGVVRLTNGIRLQAEHIKDAINKYGKTFILPPGNVYDNLDVIEIENVSPRKWSVRFDLWTEEEGRSDLSIEANPY